MKTVGIYIHIPFCVSKCKYCAFVSMVASEDDKKIVNGFKRNKFGLVICGIVLSFVIYFLPLYFFKMLSSQLISSIFFS